MPNPSIENQEEWRTIRHHIPRHEVHMWEELLVKVQKSDICDNYEYLMISEMLVDIRKKL